MIQKNCLRGSTGRVVKFHGTRPSGQQKSMPRTSLMSVTSMMVDRWGGDVVKMSVTSVGREE
jgi:hypothetical protein